MLSKHVDRFKSGVYKITNLVNGDFYIGGTSNLYNRKHTHAAKLKGGTHTSKHLSKDYNEYGADNFLFEVLEYCTNYAEREQFYMDTLKPSYNKRPFADNNTGLPVLQKQRDMISATLKQRYKEGMDCYRQQHKWKVVEQYSLEGDYIDQYPSVTHAAKHLNIHRNDILGGCKKESFFTAGYQWKYQDSDKEILPFNLSGYTGGNIRMPIKLIDISTNIWELFPGTESVSRHLNYDKKGIYQSLKDGSVRKGKYVFEYYRVPVKSDELLEKPEEVNQQPS